MIDNGFNIFSIVSVIVPILVLGIFAFTIIMIFSPKLRGKMLSHQIKSLKYMADYSKDDIQNIATTMGDISINSTKNILDNNEDNLKHITEKTSDLGSIFVEKTARAIKDGITNNNVYCKHCGKSIDSDSKFCKNCGKEV